MHECTSIIINSFYLFQRTLFNKGFVVEGEREVLKEWMKTNRESGGEGLSLLNLYAHSVKKIACFFKQWLLLIVLLKRHRHFCKLIFIYVHVNIFIVVIVYICVKNIAIFYVEFTKKIILSHFTPQFFIQKNS